MKPEQIQELKELSGKIEAQLINPINPVFRELINRMLEIINGADNAHT